MNDENDFVSSVIAAVLTVLPFACIRRIAEIIQLMPNNDSAACADLVCQHLLEGEALQLAPFEEEEPPQPVRLDVADLVDLTSSPLVNEENIMDDSAVIEGSNEPEVVQSRKRHAEDELNPHEEDDIPNLSALFENGDSAIYECSCCYEEVPFEDMVQCAEAHLFCMECLRRYTKEAVYGQFRTTMTCMTTGCDANFPTSQLMRALPEDLRRQYEERIAQEALNLADLPNLFRCPFCNYQAILDDDQHIFVCPNEECKKRTCRDCGVLWEEHEGLLCNQIEKETETKLRLDFEEKMADARIRTCSACKAKFTKETGCNRITCRCGQQLCYVCRAPINGYDHFCQHPRNPGKPCKSCQSCFLWTNAEFDDNLAITEIKQQANQARLEQGFEVGKEIGAPTSPKSEKAAAVKHAQPTRPPRPARPRGNRRAAVAAALGAALNIPGVPPPAHAGAAYAAVHMAAARAAVRMAAPLAAAAAAQNPALPAAAQNPALQVPVGVHDHFHPLHDFDFLRDQNRMRMELRNEFLDFQLLHPIDPRANRQARVQVPRLPRPPRQPQRQRRARGAAAYENPLQEPRMGGQPIPIPAHAAQPDLPPPDDPRMLFRHVRPNVVDLASVPFARGAAGPEIGNAQEVPDLFLAPRNERPLLAGGQQCPLADGILGRLENALARVPLFPPANPIVRLNKRPLPTVTRTNSGATAPVVRPISVTATGCNNNPPVLMNRIPATATIVSNSATVQANHSLYTTLAGSSNNPAVPLNRIPVTASIVSSSVTVQANRPLYTTATGSNTQANRPPNATATTANSSAIAQANRPPNATATSSNGSATAQPNSSYPAFPGCAYNDLTVIANHHNRTVQANSAFSATSTSTHANLTVQANRALPGTVTTASLSNSSMVFVVPRPLPSTAVTASSYNNSATITGARSIPATATTAISYNNSATATSSNSLFLPLNRVCPATATTTNANRKHPSVPTATATSVSDQQSQIFNAIRPIAYRPGHVNPVATVKNAAGQAKPLTTFNSSATGQFQSASSTATSTNSKQPGLWNPKAVTNHGNNLTVLPVPQTSPATAAVQKNGLGTTHLSDEELAFLRSGSLKLRPKRLLIIAAYRKATRNGVGLPSGQVDWEKQHLNGLAVENFAEAFWGPVAGTAEAYKAFNDLHSLERLANALDKVRPAATTSRGTNDIQAASTSKARAPVQLIIDDSSDSDNAF